ncbi:pyridoxamine 5'-phosphate oxidase family protein [Kitasatospora kifunensis]|uniref:Nitroimidazol reductase NimA-like FMN-containing flavoprotein (Pyridoxamine 5'-phosphate oxidase superfamily) n=1 Tax=Kitasatospora kifunensis TaxID=58351 RepID=A0A7W7VT73_KITKI|nr:pyridoxamine 5'-phosphate oxidase family protein [Kitasatospora kifunensis]MBB4921150.1 nitroimidazol reductase NimA-like FMN-containing flavoprotein (pyridoxamine 5'-phosphate oxidase superfamily) [Kitasatospora kifunensis]
MDYLKIVHLVNTDPVIQTLLAAPIPMRLGYVGLDGHPRTLPVSYLWNGKAFVFATPPTAYKVKAIAAHPEVSFTVDTTDFTPLIMMVRGKASIEVKPGVPEEHIEASRRMVGEEKMAEWERVKRESTDEMAVISIIPTHVTVCDFDTRFPPPVSVNARAHGAG